MLDSEEDLPYHYAIKTWQFGSDDLEKLEKIGAMFIEMGKKLQELGRKGFGQLNPKEKKT